MNRFAIGVDVGGTTIKAGLVDDEGRLLAAGSFPTPTDADSPEQIVAAIVGAAEEIRARAHERRVSVEGIGFGLPTYSIGPSWIQTMASNIPVLEGYPLYPSLREAFGSAIACDQDTHAATLAELRFGAGVGVERLIFVGVGTGISCGIVVDGGELLRYTFGTSGDTGHLIVDPAGGELCTCGGRGCLETVASARAIRTRAVEAARAGASPVLAELHPSPELLEARDVARAARLGDPIAKSILARAGEALGVAITSLMHVYCPHTVLVGGGVAEADELLLDPARRTIERLAAPFYRRELRELRRASLGPEAGVVGAATLILFPT